eukprot:m.12008 g.12008  ORF g.12008 m.12008 type:complete len:152 (-) comp7603_c0_seq1:19-474(-)
MGEPAGEMKLELQTRRPVAAVGLCGLCGLAQETAIPPRRLALPLPPGDVCLGGLLAGVVVRRVRTVSQPATCLDGPWGLLIWFGTSTIAVLPGLPPSIQPTLTPVNDPDHLKGRLRFKYSPEHTPCPVDTCPPRSKIAGARDVPVTVAACA